jgi:hypothetical protein
MFAIAAETMAKGMAMIISQIFTAAATWAPWWSFSSRLWDSLSALQWAAVISALVLTVGAVLEYWVKLKLLTLLIGKWAFGKSSAFDRCALRKLLIHSLGPILVVLGIAGDFVFEGRAFILEDRQEEEARKTIGSLAEQAKQADREAQTAISDSSTALGQAKDALAKAGAAEASLSKAEAEAKDAQTASSSALTMAKDAHKEADAFEEEIKSAKKQAADIAKQLTPRSLSHDDTKAIGDKMKRFSPRFIGRKIQITSYTQDLEGIVFSVEVFHIFDDTGIEIDPVIGRLEPIGLVETGVRIVGPIRDQDVIKLLVREIHDRADTEVSGEWKDEYKQLAIFVAFKPIAGLPKIIRPTSH